jgi:hypothetical protein
MDDFQDYAEPITTIEQELRNREEAMDFQLTKLSEAKRPFRLPTKGVRRQDIQDAFSTAFELIGGIPRLAIWANDNPDKFYPLFARINSADSKQISGKLVIEHTLKRSKLDEVTVDENGKVLEGDVTDE